MSDVAYAVSGIPIRLTDERWGHIAEGHPELAKERNGVLQALTRPDEVRLGTAGECIAVARRSDLRYNVVVYREEAQDGFVITAFVTSRRAQFDRRRLLWERPRPRTS